MENPKPSRSFLWHWRNFLVGLSLFLFVTVAFATTIGASISTSGDLTIGSSGVLNLTANSAGSSTAGALWYDGTNYFGHNGVSKMNLNRAYPTRAFDSNLADIDGSQDGNQSTITVGAPSVTASITQLAVNGAAVIFDPVTNLYWSGPACNGTDDHAGSTNCNLLSSVGFSRTTAPYADASNFCDKLILDADGNSTDETSWRLPTINELTLLAFDQTATTFIPGTSHSIDNVTNNFAGDKDSWFPSYGGGNSFRYWSSTTLASNANYKFTLSNITPLSPNYQFPPSVTVADGSGVSVQYFSCVHSR